MKLEIWEKEEIKPASQFHYVRLVKVGGGISLALCDVMGNTTVGGFLLTIENGHLCLDTGISENLAQDVGLVLNLNRSIMLMP